MRKGGKAFKLYSIKPRPSIIAGVHRGTSGSLHRRSFILRAHILIPLETGSVREKGRIGRSQRDGYSYW